jgi:hypothetical protein
MEDQARVGGIVVGDEHERALGPRIPRPGDDVRRGPPRQHAAHELAAVGGVVGDEPRRGRGHEPRRPPAPRRPGPAGRRARGEPEAGRQAERHVERAARPLGLERDLPDPPRAQLSGDPLGRRPLPRGRRRALEGRELLDERAQLQGLGAGRAGHARHPRGAVRRR